MGHIIDYVLCFVLNTVMNIGKGTVMAALCQFSFIFGIMRNIRGMMILVWASCHFM